MVTVLVNFTYKLCIFIHRPAVNWMNAPTYKPAQMLFKLLQTHTPVSGDKSKLLTQNVLLLQTRLEKEVKNLKEKLKKDFKSAKDKTNGDLQKMKVSFPTYTITCVPLYKT